MANLAVFTSGSGTNFQAIAELINTSKHKLVCMICNRKDAYSFERAKNLGIKSYYVCYKGKTEEEAENEIIEILKKESVDLVALAGFMKILTPNLIDKYHNRIINIHPALLPKHPGAHGIEDSFNSSDEKLGITIHYVDYGMDTGPTIKQDYFIREKNETLESAEKKIHELEYKNYGYVLLNLLDNLEK